MIHVFCERGSDGARDLVLALRTLGVKARRQRGKLEPARFAPARGDLIVPWGTTYPRPIPNGVKLLNPKMIFNKWEELATLREAGVKTPPFALRPQGALWLPRRANHQGGTDLLHPPARGDYYVQKLVIEKEFRVHVVNGVVIRVGKKSPRPGFPNAHPWIRSWDAGWRLIYDFNRDLIPNGVRAAGKAAIKALGLDFGAADIGVGPDGVFVFEVNKAPGLELKSASVYAKHFAEIAKGIDQ